MNIQQRGSTTRGEFFIREEDHTVASITFKPGDDGSINIVHTEVDESLGGQGVGAKLVAAVVQHAREHNLKVVADCPYARKVLDRTDEFADVAK